MAYGDFKGKETNFIKNEIVKSKQLGCMVNAFLKVVRNEQTTLMTVTHIPIDKFDNRNHVVSEEIVPTSYFDTYVGLILNGLTEV
jgi:hypothetical protein